VVDRQQRPTAPGAGVPRDPAPLPESPRGRRVLDTAANDNLMSPVQRVARAALFVAVGAVVAWLLRELFG
jgi:hypothetical protein